MSKYKISDVELPPLNKYVYGVVGEGHGCICAWRGSSWGAHIYVYKWRPLTLLEWIKLQMGIIKPYTRLG